jgi:hypothetical protein
MRQGWRIIINQYKPETDLRLTVQACDVGPSIGEGQCGRSGARQARSETRGHLGPKARARAAC